MCRQLNSVNQNYLFFILLLKKLRKQQLIKVLCELTILQVDTNLESPNDLVPEGVPGVKETYNMAPYSSIILQAKP